ncbi:MAG: hypothetical protein J6Z40_09360 [Oscillospiraceae bacterium]|nr:hypothetical protein [Oscillospiraceae bacterium]MBQ5339358.1 hypothetical protein [Oscillospiraceae bacterium]
MPEIMVRFDDLRRYCEKRHCGSVPLEYIKQMRTVEAEPVRHGRWKNIPGMNNTVFCSECLMAANKELAMKYKGCPFCLARMDGGAEDDT